MARDLAPLGYDVTVFDQDPRAGGMIWSQIPRFRLPMEVIDEEVGYILDLGVSFKQRKIDSMKQLLARRLRRRSSSARGAPRGRDLDIPGRKEGAANIHIGIDWLSSVSFGHTTKIGKRVIVLGGGNTAMDCCRTSQAPRRRGREGHRALGLRRDEGEPVGEGGRAARGHSDPRTTSCPRPSSSQNGKLTGMTFEKVKAVYDDKGRRNLVPTGEPEQIFECDDVLVAVGQENAFPWIERDSGIAFDKWGMPALDTVTFQSTRPERLLRRRRRVRPEEHHLGGGARPRRRRLDRQAAE